MSKELALSSSSAQRLLLSASALAMLAVPVLAQAQSTDPDKGDAANEDVIIVTATKREQTLQEVPVAVSVTAGEVLEREQIRDLKDLQALVPSLRVNQLQSSANTNFVIRGFGNGANNAGIEPSVGVFVDGVYRSRTASQISDLPSVERIEVLRGPQSTLFGKNASAGVISIVTKKPAFNTEGQIEMTYGNYNAMVFKGYVTGPISDNVAVSVAAGTNLRDGYIDDLGTGRKTNERNRWFTRGQLLFEGDSPLTARFIADYNKIDENCCATVNIRSSASTTVIQALGGRTNAPSQMFDDMVYNNFDSTNDIENYGFSGQLDYEIGSGTLTSITAYRRTNAITDQDSDFTSADLIGRNYQDLRLKTFTQELRYNAELSDQITLLLGGYYFDEKVDQSNQLLYGNQFRPYADLLIQGGTGGAFNIGSLNTMQDLELILGGLDFAAGNGASPAQYVGQFFAPGQGFVSEEYTLKNTAYSIFGQIDFEVTEGLVLTLGGNYTKDKKTFTANLLSNDVWSGLDLDAPQYAPFRQQILFQGGLAQQIGNALMLGRPATAAEIGGFAQANPAAFGQISAAVGQFAAANANNPAVNPLNPLKPLQFLPPFLNVPNAVEPGKTDDGNFSYTARVAYDVSDDINVYASYGTGFKASSINLSRDSRPLASDAAALGAAGLTVNNLSYGTRFASPEKSRVIEFGLKGDWGDYGVNIAAFRQTINGFQSNVFTGTGFGLANAGKQRTDGVEFEGRANPIEQLSFNLGVTYLDPKYISFTNSTIGDITGRRPAGVPKWTVVFGTQWEQELANGDAIIIGGTYTHESKVQMVEGLPAFLDPSLPDGGQAQAIAAAAQFSREVDELSASFTYETEGGLSFSIWGRNLLDDRYLLQIFDTPAQLGSVNGYPNQPRTYGVTVRGRF